MKWGGFAVGAAVVGIAVWLYSDEEGETVTSAVSSDDVPFKEADGATKYPRLPICDKDKPRLWTLEELKLRNGSNANRELLLSVAGEVYDVGSGEQHYSPGMGYAGFCGRDASRAYVTGEYNETEVNGMEDLTPDQINAVFDWRDFYRTHEQYRFVGLLVGDYYDENGQPTNHLIEVQEKHRKVKELGKLKTKLLKKYIQCNSKHEMKKTHFEIWCDDSWHPKGSTPIHMWTSYPGIEDKEMGRCVCITPELLEEAEKLNADPDDPAHRRFVKYSECEENKQKCYRPKGAQGPGEKKQEEGKKVTGSAQTGLNAARSGQ